MVGNLDLFSRKAGFNAALRHFKFTTGLVERISKGENLADLLGDAEAKGVIVREQMAPIISALLVDKFDYAVQSRNVYLTIEDSDSIITSLSSWTALQIVVVYQHPEVGLFAINPRSRESWDAALPILKDELLVVYVKSMDDSLNDQELEEAVDNVFSVLMGEEVSCDYTAKSGNNILIPKTRTPQSTTTAIPSASHRITPRYSVVVTNELFHNGNVEAWKRIIASYRSTYSDLDVLIYYDNERIKDINTLFKWGKVKHGTPIMISVAGSNIRDVSKLQRYLFEGASPRFESFLKGSIDQPLELF